MYPTLFANDLILFVEANDEACEAIPNVLHQKVSMEKSRIYFSSNMDLEKKEEKCSILGIHSTTTFKKYLGFPLRHKGTRRN